MTNRTGRFVHHRLDAYRVALQLFAGVEELANALPRGQAELKDQMRRAAGATVRNLAEGANRFRPRDKAARFMIARAECGECDAALEMAALIHVCDHQLAKRLRQLADRVAAMLLG